MNLLRVNTLKDYGNFCLHFGLASTVSAGAFLALGVPPVLSAIALGATAAAHFGFDPALRQSFQDAINAEKTGNLKGKNVTHLVPSPNNPDLFVPEKSHDPRFLNNVRSWISDFSGCLDLKDEPHLLVMPPTPKKLRRKKGGDESLKVTLRNFLRTTFNEKANAFAFTHHHGNVVLNNPIVNALDEREIKGVVAHEMAHLGAGHTMRSKLLAMVSTPAKILTSLNSLITTFSSVKNIGLVLMAGAGAKYATGKIAAYRGWDEDDDKDKAKMKSLKKCLGNIGIFGLGLVFQAPDLLLAQAINLGTKASLFLLEKRNSRCNEFQADRVAGQLTGEPDALASGLQKIRIMHAKPNAPAVGSKDMLSTIFSSVRDYDKTHPHIDRRCARLHDMARVNGPSRKVNFCMP